MNFVRYGGSILRYSTYPQKVVLTIKKTLLNEVDASLAGLVGLDMSSCRITFVRWLSTKEGPLIPLLAQLLGANFKVSYRHKRGP